jgi:predicted amidophosphoribosyltransferase
VALVALGGVAAVTVAVVYFRRRPIVGSNLQPCLDCNRMIPKTAAVCPQCGRMFD